MRFNSVLLLLLFAACSERDSPIVKKDCRLVKIVVNDKVETTYTYNAAGKMVTQVRVNGSNDFSFTYTYLASGNIDHIDLGETVATYIYEDGELAGITTTDEDYGNALSTQTYTWTKDKVRVVLHVPQKPNPVQIREYELVNGNVSRVTNYSYNGKQSNNLLSTTEYTYQNYDSGLNPFYLAASTRPWYGSIDSKNNPEIETLITTVYDDGGEPQSLKSVTRFAYTYNAAMAITSSVATNETTGIKTTAVVTYDTCD